MSNKVPEKSAASAGGLALVSVTAAIALAASFCSAASESFEGWANRYERWQADRLAVLPVVFTSVLCFYCWRRWRDLGREADEREKAQEALRVREGERCLRAVVADTPVVLLVSDRGVFALSEGRGLKALEPKPGRVVGSTFETRYSPRGKDGEIAGVVYVADDTIERKRVEEELREANRRLNELAVLKADFTAMVAHELGSPLAAIRRLTEMLDTGEVDRDVKAYAIDAISGELDTLDALVADVQASAAVERDDFGVELRPVPLGELLADARAFALTLPDGHPVNIVLGPNLGARERVVADPERIGQVLRNLLSNAAKYSPEGVPIDLRAEREGGRVRVEVADHGPGIHPEDVVRIFEKFGRGRDREGKKIKGVGLGLYISRGIVRAHGGDLTVKSAPGEGAVFGFELQTTKEA